MENRPQAMDPGNLKANGNPLAGSARDSSSTMSTERRRFRARFTGGVFVPAESLDIPEDTEFEVEIRKTKP
jgi:hypothetical protein